MKFSRRINYKLDLKGIFIITSAPYKKYFLAQQSKAYIFSKYPNESYWKQYFRANFLKGIAYRIAHIFGMEQWLVNRRNIKISPVKPYTAYQDENKTI